MTRAPITADWLRESGFRWLQMERQPDKHWLLWIGDVVRASDGSLTSTEDIGIELAPCGKDDPRWFCWFRSDASHRYGRFIHVRHLRWQHEVIALVEVCSGQAWNPANARHGSLHTPEQTARWAEEDKRLDRVLRDSGHPWGEGEKDPTRAGATHQHLDEHIRRRKAEGKDG